MANIIHRGRVLDAFGKPLYQAHVITINSDPKRGVVTDQEGYFTVDGGLHEAFEITHIGFKPRIFRLERYMTDKTYNLNEDATELNEVVVSPRNPAPQRPRVDLGSIFQTIGNVFGENKNNGVNTPPFNPIDIKVPTITNPIFVPKPDLPPVLKTRVNNTPIQDGNSITDWIKDNPIATAGIVLGTLALGALALGKKKDKITDPTPV